MAIAVTRDRTGKMADAERAKLPNVAGKCWARRLLTQVTTEVATGIEHA